MLQFLARTSDKYSIPEQAQMAIEGGCAWVHLRVPDLDDAAVREMSADLIPLCRESSTILTIDDRYELAKELAIHGVLLTAGSGLSPVAIRDILGPEAIIGVEVGSAASILALQGKDIDYTVLTPDTSVDDMALTVTTVASADMSMPIVASGDISLQTLPEIISAGVNGILTGRHIVDAHDPVEATSQFLAALTADKN